MAELVGGTRVEALARARNGVMAAFAFNGLCFASWLSRAPAARDALSLSAAQLGFLLLCLSGGACLALPASGPAVHRWGAARVVLFGSVLVGLGLLGLAAGLATGTVSSAAVGLVLTGVGMSNWDVAMNVAGADVERRRGRSLMPRLHAGFSLGTVTGGGAGAALAAWQVPLAIQVAVAALSAPVAMLFAVRSFLVAETPETEEPSGKGDALRAWREPRTLLIGLLTLCAAFAEGSANDWLAVALVDGHQTTAVVGALGFGVFVTAMTIGRLAGGTLLDRFGRVLVLRSLLAAALVGLLLVAFASSIVWVLIGALFWGFGASLGFPVGMSAASDEPTRAAARVGVVSSVAYTAFLAGPPLIGLLAEHSGILHALLVVLGALVIALLVAGAARPPELQRAQQS